MPKPRAIKVFIASPGDLAVERRAFKDTVDSLNKGFGRGADVEFLPLGWEDALSQVGRRSQSVINQDVDACDVFILVMWRRWGQKATNAKPYSSYTEEEFYRALARYEKCGAPAICVFFKHIDTEFLTDPGTQLKKVLAFRRKLERAGNVLYHSFTDATTFAAEIDRHLVAHAKSKETGSHAPSDEPIIPDSIQSQLDRQQAELEKHREEARRALEELEKLKRDAQRTVEEAMQKRKKAKNARTRSDAAELVADAKSAEQTLELAESAAKAALEGRVEEARQMFAKALEGTTNLRVLYLGQEFFHRIGEVNEAERLLERSLAISGRNAENVDTAVALRRLGVIARNRGDLDGAKKLYREALKIERKLNRPAGEADNLGNLGNLAWTRGDLGTADKLHREALEIDRKLGRLEGQANHLGNLGLIAWTRGDLDAAEKLDREALEINRQLARPEGQAIQLANLGLIAQDRGDLDAAEKLHREALEIYRKLGSIDGQAIELGNLGGIAHSRGDLDAAEKLRREALEIDRKLGRLEGQAIQLANLGSIAKDRGNLTDARRLWTQSRDLYARIGMPQMVKQVQGWFDSLPPK